MRRPCSIFTGQKPARLVISVLAFFFLATYSSTAQLGYSFAPSTGTFTELTDGTTPVLNGNSDMGYYDPIDIFNFDYNGTVYTSVAASTKGWMTFGQAITDCLPDNNLSSGGQRPLLAPLWDDIAMDNETDFSWKIEGVAGSQVFTAQWKNVRWSYMAFGPVISFQVKLYEATGLIEFIYRQETETVVDATASIGITAGGTGANNFISLQSTDAGATASTTVETSNLASCPATDQVFSFTPVSGPQIQISSANPAVPAGNMIQNSANNIIYAFNIDVTQAQTTFTGIQFTTSGTYAAADLRFLKVYYSSDAALSVSTDKQLGRTSTGLGQGTHIINFGSNSQALDPNTTGYIFIVADLYCTSSATKTVIVEAIIPSGLSFTSGTVTGTTYPGDPQTIIAVTPPDVTSPAAASGGTSATLTWTNPGSAFCFNEIMIVAKPGSSITGVPSGDGSSYTASLVYGSGTGFDGGYVVFKGTTPTNQVVTNLTPGTTYYFKFFTRQGTLWSPGIETSVTLSAVTDGDYRSLKTGPWNDVATWERFSGGVWGTPVSPPDNNSGIITIQNTHNVSVTALATADQLTVNAGGTLTIGSGVSFTIADGTGTDCTVSGTLSNAGTVTPTGTLVFNGTGVYIHNRDGGNIPISTWNTGSTCRITGVSANVPGNRSQTFSNFTWNCATPTTTLSLIGQPSNVTGTFTVTSTGTGQNNGLRLGGDVTYTNFVQTGGNFFILNGTTPRTMNVTNFTLQGGTFNMSDSPGTTGTLNINGNFTVNTTTGSITESRNDRGHIVFKGTGAQQTFSSNKAIGGTDQIDFTINNGAYLQMATDATKIDGGGVFTLSAGGTLGITSPNGITSSGTTGNIQTRTRIYNTGGHYLYNRTGTQVTGNGLPVAAISGNITISSSATVQTTNPVIGNGTLTVNGTLQPGLENHVISGTGTLTGTGRVLVNRVSDSPEFLAQYTIANKTLTGLTVEYDVATGNQVISATDYGNLKLNNTSGENVLSGTATVSGSMTTSSGIFTVDASGFLTAGSLTNQGYLNINSFGKASVNTFVNNGTLYMSSASLAEYASLRVDNYSGTGTANVELYLTGGGTVDAPKWHYIAVPVNYPNTSILTDINIYNLMRYDDFYVTDQSDPATVDEGFVWWDNYDGKGGFNTLETGRGYAFYHTEDVVVYYGGLTSLQTNIGNRPLQWNGAGKSYPQYYGYNVLGNSLTCGLDWNLVAETGNVDDAVYYLVNYDIASYVRNAPDGINGGTKDIPPLQGFMVKANASGSALNFTNAREHTTQPRYKKGAVLVGDSKSGMDAKSQDPAPMVKLELNKNGNDDETLIWFAEGATKSFDGDYDAYKMSYETGSDIYTMSGETKLGINGLPMPEEETIIPVTVRLKEQGSNYKIIAQKIQGLDGFRVTLTDKYNGNAVTDLNANPEYSFAGNPGAVSDRFILTISKLTTGTKEDVTLTEQPFSIYGFNNSVNIKLQDSRWEGKKSILNIYDLTGNKVFADNKVEWTYGDLKQYNTTLRQGVYIVEIVAEKERFVSKVHLF